MNQTPMTDEKAVEIVAERMELTIVDGTGLYLGQRIVKTWGGPDDPYKLDDDDKLEQALESAHAVPDYLNSHDALQPVLAKMTPEEKSKLVRILHERFGFECERPEIIWWTLTIPARDLCRAMATAILEARK